MSKECQLVTKVVGAELWDAEFTSKDLGGLKALLSPQHQLALRQLDPRAGGRVTYEDNERGGCTPQVHFKHLDPDREYTVKESPSCSADKMTSNHLTETFAIEQYAESGFHIDYCGMQTLCEELEVYERAITKNYNTSNPLYKGRWQTTMAANMIVSVKDILEHVNDKAVSEIVGNIGMNPIYGTDVAQEIPLYDGTAGMGVTRYLYHEIDNIRRRLGYYGKLIILTGSDHLANFLKDVCLLACCSASGIDMSKVQAQNLEFYFDYDFADALGQDGFLIMLPNSMAFLNVDQFTNIKQTIGSSRIANTHMGHFAIHEPGIRRYDVGCERDTPNPVFRFDLRVIEQDCDGDTPAPKLTFIPSLTYDIWKRPENGGVTGIFRYKVRGYVPIEPAEYTVTFEADGGNPAPAQQENLKWDDKVTEPAAMTKAGHTFVGWFSDPAFNFPWDFESDGVRSNLTLYAQWEED